MTKKIRYRAVALDQKLTEQGRRKDWLASQVGVHPSIISHLIAGRRTADQSLAVAIAKQLGEENIFLIFDLPDGSESIPTEASAA